MHRQILAAALGAALIVSATAAQANDQCLSQLKQSAQERGFAYDTGNNEVIVWSPERKTIAPVFANLQRCLRSSYKKSARRKINGENGTFYGTTVAGGGGADICELPDLGPMGGRGEHRGEYTVWVHCYHLGGGSSGLSGSGGSMSSGDSGGALDCSRPAQWSACANRALNSLSGAR